MAEVAIENRIYRHEAKPQPTANKPGKIVEAFGLGKCPKLAEQVCCYLRLLAGVVCVQNRPLGTLRSRLGHQMHACAVTVVVVFETKIAVVVFFKNIARCYFSVCNLVHLYTNSFFAHTSLTCYEDGTFHLAVGCSPA